MKNGTAKGTALSGLPLNYEQSFRLQLQLKQEIGGEEYFLAQLKWTNTKERITSLKIHSEKCFQCLC